jgi:tetratricopeptide (TPR) repeat protein
VELTITQKLLWLRLRMNGIDFFTSSDGVDPERPDELLAPAAEIVFELADPYIAAASLVERDPSKSLEIARLIIAGRPETDRSVSWAHSLVGIVLDDEHKTNEAIAEYRKAIDLDPRNASFHSNLGQVLGHQAKTVEQAAEFQKAIELDPSALYPHLGLGADLRILGQTEAAIAELRKGVELYPGEALSHLLLGEALRDQHKDDEAIAEYRKAIALDPRDAMSQTI